MSQADELLKTLIGVNANSRLVDPTLEEHIIIDESRVIRVPESLKRIGVQYDHNIETVTFDCPRFWDGIDLSKKKIYINYMRANKELGSHLAQNVTVDTVDNTIMHFNWTISNHVTQYKGPIVFLVCIQGNDGPSYTPWTAMSGIDNVHRYNGITYGDGRFVCVGLVGSSYYSTDGETWTAMKGLSLNAYNNVAYGNGRFVAVGDSGRAHYSTDGKTWTAMSGQSGNIYNVTYGDGKFVCIGYGKSYYSTNGETWNDMSGLDSIIFKGLTYGNGRYVCVGNAGKSQYSTDGKTWSTIIDITDGTGLLSVTYGDGKFVCVGNYGVSYYSTDGETWTAMSGLNVSNHYYSVTYGNGRFVCVGTGGKTYYSIDGKTWNAMSELDSIDINGVAYGNGRFVCVCYDGKTYYSVENIDDGIHWNSELNNEMYISEGLECAETIIEAYPDIFTQMLQEMDTTKAFAEDCMTVSQNAADSSKTFANEAKDAASNATNAYDQTKMYANYAANEVTTAQNLNAEVRKLIDSGKTVGPQGPQGPQGVQGPQGPQGPKGDTGDSGIATPIGGIYSLGVDSDGNLCVYSNDEDSAPEFEIDSSGNLYMLMEVDS